MVTVNAASTAYDTLWMDRSGDSRNAAERRGDWLLRVSPDCCAGPAVISLVTLACSGSPSLCLYSCYVLPTQTPE